MLETLRANGFNACLFWQYDTAEQPELWPATADGGRILQALTSRDPDARE